MSAEQLLGSVEDQEAIIVADLEAGIGTLTRLEEAAIDLTVVVVEPTPRSIDVARRAVAVASERRQGRLLVVANKVSSDDDRERIRAGLEVDPDVVVPDDDAVVAADRSGVSLVDEPGDHTALGALEALAGLVALPSG